MGLPRGVVQGLEILRHAGTARPTHRRECLGGLGLVSRQRSEARDRAAPWGQGALPGVIS